MRVVVVPDGRWTNPSPCEGWSARDVVRHLVDVHGHFLGNVPQAFSHLALIEAAGRIILAERTGEIT